jgi:hypothetical protein
MQPVIAKVPEPVADAQDLFDQEVDGFGGSVTDASDGEVGQKFGAPGAEGARQSA